MCLFPFNSALILPEKLFISLSVILTALNMCIQLPGHTLSISASSFSSNFYGFFE